MSCGQSSLYSYIHSDRQCHTSCVANCLQINQVLSSCVDILRGKHRVVLFFIESNSRFKYAYCYDIFFLCERLERMYSCIIMRLEQKHSNQAEDKFNCERSQIGNYLTTDIVGLFQAKMPQIVYLQPLDCEDLLLVLFNSIVYGVFWVLDWWTVKTDVQRVSLVYDILQTK